MSRKRNLLAGATLALAAALAIPVVPAFAHESIRSSSPVEGQVFETAPAQVELVFTDEIMTIGAVVLVVDESGKDWVQGDLSIDGATVVASLESGMPEAGYEVRWRVVSGDGHPISSLIPFTIGDAEPLQPAEQPTVTTVEPSASPDASTDADSGSALSPWQIALIGAGGATIALALYLIISLFRRRNAVRHKVDAASPAATPHTDERHER